MSPNLRLLILTAVSLLDIERVNGMCGSHHEAWRWRCDGVGALLVTLLVMQSKLRAHLTSMATIPSHLVCTYLFSNRTMTPNAPLDYVRAICPKKREME